MSATSLDRVRIVVSGLLVIVLFGLAAPGQGAEDPKKPAEYAWTLEEALQQLSLHPSDPYLQYVALQLAKREKRQDEVFQKLQRIDMADANGRRSRGDLFSTFTGALAVQESLQLDTMRGGRPRAIAVVPKGNFPPKPPEKKLPARVAVADLIGPGVESHPWAKMLGDKKPEVGALANCVPEDFYFIEFRSAARFNEVARIGEVWGGHIFTQMLGEAKSQTTLQRIKTQLGLAQMPPTVMEALEIEGIAVAGSDLFLAEGSDVTVLVESKKLPALVKSFEALLSLRGQKEEGKYLDIPYAHLRSPDGKLNVYYASPRPDLHVRGNSLAGFQRVLETVVGKTADGKPAKRLGESKEFQYIRTLMPRGAVEEDGLVYLSDAFIRNLVGPRLKLTERRRVLVYNHLRMIGNAALLFRTEHGRAPRSLEELAETQCAPGVFGKGDLAHPDGGSYSLSADGMMGVCSKYGTAEAMTPCIETLVAEVTGEEAEEYRDFVRDYNQYWRTFFDPIAIRVQVSAQQYRLETLILPLIDNSIYTTMAQAVGGKVVPLDELPTGRRELGGVWLHLDKQPILDILGPEVKLQAKEEPKRGVKSIREATNDLKQLGLALQAYHDTYGQFPPAAGRDKDGKPILSWRVAMLPYIEQNNLYQRFKLDEPWDSVNNKKLIQEMPKIFQGPNKKLNEEWKTVYLAPVGKETIFPPDGAKIRITDVFDGASNTIMLVEAADDEAAVWTKPDDLAIDLKKPLKGLLRPGQSTFPALMADGGVRPISRYIPPEQLAAAFTRAGGEVVFLDARNPSPRKPDDAPKQPLDFVNDLKQVALAMLNYEAANNRLPPAATRDKDGKALLSWRVAVLPYLEEGELYQQFKQNEPWDSEHNKKLIARMPRIFKGLNKKLNEEGKTSLVAPVGKETVFPPTGEKVGLLDITDGTFQTIAALLANDDAAVVWTKPDDLVVDLKMPLKGLERQGQEGFLVAMVDAGVRNLRATIDPVKLAALLTRAGGEVLEINPQDELRLPSNNTRRFLLDLRPSQRDLERFEALGLDTNKLRRFVRDGIGDQVGLQMHDASKFLEYDVAGALGGGAGIGAPISGAEAFGLGMLIQFFTSPASISIPVKDVKAVDEFLDEMDRWGLKMREEALGEFRNNFDFYKLPFRKPHVVRCYVVDVLGLKWRIFWGRIGNGLYFANRPFILEDLATAYEEAAKQPRKKTEPAHMLLRLRPENWQEVLPGYNLGWAEGQRAACSRNVSLLANVHRGWHDRKASGATIDAALMEQVARFYGVRPFCPDGGKYQFSADGKSCRCSIHGTDRDPSQPPAPAPASPTGKLLKSFAGLRATLSFEEEGLRAVVTIERKE